jgi:molybdopterin converting factor small subunit
MKNKKKESKKKLHKNNFSFRIVIATLAVTATIFAQANWTFPFWKDANIWVVAAIKFVILMGLYLLGELAKNRFDAAKKPFYELFDYNNKNMKNNIFINTAEVNDANSSEQFLRDGDEIHIVTNALETYDLPILDKIAERLMQGVSYYYYLPAQSVKVRKNGKKFFEEIEKYVQSKKEISKELKTTTLKKIRFYNIGEESDYCYNYSLSIFDKNNDDSDSERNAVDTVAWYMALNNDKNTVDDILFAQHLAKYLSAQTTAGNESQINSSIAHFMKDAQAIIKIRECDRAKCTVDEMKCILKNLGKKKIVLEDDSYFDADKAGLESSLQKKNT